MVGEIREGFRLCQNNSVDLKTEKVLSLSEVTVAVVLLQDRKSREVGLSGQAESSSFPNMRMAICFRKGTCS